MTKLEWCRQHAPDAIKNYSDADLLEAMSSSYDMFCTEKEDVDVLESVEPSSPMDYMVLELVKEFGDKLAFKGGYMLTKLIPDSARQTADIDFSIESSELYHSLINAMERIGDHFISINYISSYRIKPTIERRMSGGMDMFDTTGKKILGIDIGWHDLHFGTTTTKIDICELRAFEVERMLADKITAILSRKRFRRPKDLYDLYCITNCFNFDANKVNEYILLRTEGAGADWQNFPFSEDIEREYRRAYNSLNVVSQRDNVQLEKPIFEDVFERFQVIGRRLLNVDGYNLWNSERCIFCTKIDS